MDNPKTIPKSVALSWDEVRELKKRQGRGRGKKKLSFSSVLREFIFLPNGDIREIP